MGSTGEIKEVKKWFVFTVCDAGNYYKFMSFEVSASTSENASNWVKRWVYAYRGHVKILRLVVIGL
jgi:hypothetical protein